MHIDVWTAYCIWYVLRSDTIQVINALFATATGDWELSRVCGLLWPNALWDYTKLRLIHLSHPIVKKLMHLAVAAAGPVLLGAEGPAGGVAWSALGTHLGLQQTQLHQHCAVQAQAHLVCSDWPGGRLDRC